MTEAEQRIREALAAGPTPGPWVSFYKHKYDEWHVGVPLPGQSMKLALFPDGCPTERPQADAEFIAACNPENIATVFADRGEREAKMQAEIERLRAERDALRELLLFAGQELVCGCAGIDGDDPQDVGEGWQESHWCPRCDDSVDRNWELRTRIRAALAQTGANDVVTSNEGMKT